MEHPESGLGQEPVETTEDSPLPGSPAALERGCLCPSLANAGFRIGSESEAILAPDCRLHPQT